MPVPASGASFLVWCWDRRLGFKPWVLDRQQRLLSTLAGGCRLAVMGGGPGRGRQCEEEGRPRADERCSGAAATVEERGNPTCRFVRGALLAGSCLRDVFVCYGQTDAASGRPVHTYSTPGVGKGVKARTGRAPRCLRSSAPSICLLFPPSAGSGAVGPYVPPYFFSVCW